MSYAVIFMLFKLYSTVFHRLPCGGSSNLIIVILSQNFEQLVEEHRQKPDDYWDFLHTEKTLKDHGEEGK